MYCFTAVWIWASTRKEMEKTDSGNISQSMGLADILDMVEEEDTRINYKVSNSGK